jgi:hypothetical protein
MRRRNGNSPERFFHLCLVYPLQALARSLNVADYIFI